MSSEIDQAFEQVKNQIMLDWVEWTEDMVRVKGKCPKCDFKVANFLNPEINMPYINHFYDKRNLICAQIDSIRQLLDKWIIL